MGVLPKYEHISLPTRPNVIATVSPFMKVWMCDDLYQQANIFQYAIIALCQHMKLSKAYDSSSSHTCMDLHIEALYSERGWGWWDGEIGKNMERQNFWLWSGTAKV